VRRIRGILRIFSIFRSSRLDFRSEQSVHPRDFEESPSLRLTHEESAHGDEYRSSELEKLLSKIPDLSVEILRRVWSERLNTEPPAIRSPDLLGRLLAYQLQEKEFGGLDRVTERVLARIYLSTEGGSDYAPRILTQISLGAEIVRIWKEETHKVIVVDGGFLYRGQHYRSLSVIARKITGTRWSGPRFFGLEKRPSPVRGEVNAR
jgi:hypothetical protein